MQTINNRHHCHRSTHQQYYHTRKPALKRQKRCTFATTATVAESTGLGSSSDITGTGQTNFYTYNYTYILRCIQYTHTNRTMRVHTITHPRIDTVKTWQFISCREKPVHPVSIEKSPLPHQIGRQLLNSSLKYYNIFRFEQIFDIGVCIFLRDFPGRFPQNRLQSILFICPLDPFLQT